MISNEEINIIINLDDDNIDKRLKEIRDAITELNTEAEGLTLQNATESAKGFGSVLTSLGSSLEGSGLSTVGFGLQLAGLTVQLLDNIGIFNASKSAIKLLGEEAKEATKEHANLREESQKIAEQGVKEIDYYARLKRELDGYVDANGNVQEQHRERAQFIATTLANATGLEIEMIDGTIHGYDLLSDKIEESIKQKRAKIILDAHEEAYKDAILKQADALKKVVAAEEEVAKRMKDKDKFSNEEAWQKYVNEAKDSLEACKEEYNGYTTTIRNYEQASADYIEGNYDQIEKTINDTSATYASSISERKKIAEEDFNNQLASIKMLHEQKNEMSDEQYQRELSNELSHLLNLQNAVWENAPEYAEAMAYLQGEGMDAFDENGNLTDIAQAKIDELGAQALGVSSDQYQDIMSHLSAEGINAFDKNGDLTEDARKRIDELNEQIDMYGSDYAFIMKELSSSGVEMFDENGNLAPIAETKISDLLKYLKGHGINDIDEQMDAISKLGPESFDENGDLTQTGRDTIQGYIDGAKEKEESGKFSLSNIAKSFVSSFKSIFGINSPSRVFAQFGRNTLEGYEEGFLEQSKDTLQAVEDTAKKIVEQFEDNIEMDLDDILNDLPVMDLVYTIDNTAYRNDLDTLHSQFQNRINSEMDIRTGQPIQNNYALYFNQTINSKEILSASENAMQAEALLDRERWKLK